jgi:putative DNA primase/helicase
VTTETETAEVLAVSPPSETHPQAIRSRNRPNYARTDAGNAELFADLNEHFLRYDHRRKKWLRWDKHHWVIDADRHVFRRAKAAARHRLRAAASIKDEKDREYEYRWAIESEATHRIRACLEQAMAHEKLSDTGEGWDSDPYLLGVKNGVIDLRTGRLRPGMPEDRITMTCPVVYDSSATCPRWEQFLRQIFGDDPELISYIQCAVGYSLTADVSEQCIFLAFGEGANGKSTFLKTISRVLGDYSRNLPFSAFEIGGRSSIPNDIAALVGKRIVTSVETNEATRLNEGRIKALTGGDAITARYLYAEFFTFQPVAKFWLAFNDKPRVVDNSHGFWRRIRLIPFVHTFNGKQADKHLDQKLIAEAPGILNWAIKGALEWRKTGLVTPAVVEMSTVEYREESNSVAMFIDDCCCIEAGCWVSSGDLFAAYCIWAKRQDEEYLLDRRAFSIRISKLAGVLLQRTGKERTRGWSGIKLKGSATGDYLRPLKDP